MTKNEPDHFISTSQRDGDVVALLNEMYMDAARRGCSDIHIEDEEKESVIRMRLNGSLEVWRRIDKRISEQMQDKIRMKAKMAISDNRRPLDGRIYFGVDDRIVDVRISLLPCNTGFSVVSRLLDQNNARRRLDDVEMTSNVKSEISRILDEPTGMFLISGPTGSGKTSTLYAMLNELNTTGRKIITIEDPVEYRLKGLVQVNISKDVPFADALRAILRQDPDVILVGEIRDGETARIATEASLTGHLVLSTIHASDAATTITRMLDLGVDPYTLAGAMRGVVAQRLVKKLCPACAVKKEPNALEKRWMEIQQLEIPESGIYQGEGCDECGSEGYAGRVPVLEMISIQGPVKTAVEEAQDATRIQEAAHALPYYQTLIEAGMALNAQGKTSVQQVRKITGTEIKQIGTKVA